MLIFAPFLRDFPKKKKVNNEDGNLEKYKTPGTMMWVFCSKKKKRNNNKIEGKEASGVIRAGSYLSAAQPKSHWWPAVFF